MNEQPSPALAACVATYERWLFIPDPGHLYMVLAAAQANLTPGDPVWLLLVGPPSAGKTEVVSPLVRMPWAHSAATLTEAALLSGTPKREVHPSAKGGLLREVGDFGVLVMKDFTSILAQNRDTQAQVLAALREVYDGAWTRHVGTDGGRTLEWSGKLGLIAGCTPTIDQHHAVIGSMGNRFVFYRLPSADGDADRVAEGALTHAGREEQMRGELADAASAVLAAASQTASRELTAPEAARLVALAVFATASRTAVERDPHNREVLAVPEREGPARFVGQLRLLLLGLEAIGVGPSECWRLVAKLARDAMPAGRLSVLSQLREAGTSLGTADIATAVSLPTGTTRRCLEDLSLLGAVDRAKAGSYDTAPDHWAISDWAESHWPVGTVPEIPESDIDAAGALPEIPESPSLLTERKHLNGYSGTAPAGPKEPSVARRQVRSGARAASADPVKLAPGARSHDAATLAQAREIFPNATVRTAGNGHLSPESTPGPDEDELPSEWLMGYPA